MPQDQKSDLILEGATVLNVYSGEMMQSDVAIKEDKIIYVGNHPPGVTKDSTVLPLKGKTLVPGYIDPHFHPWFIYNPLSFGRYACRHGTTTLFCDNLMFYMVMGLGRFESFMQSLTGLPVKYYWYCRAVPQTPMQDEKALFSVQNVKRLLANPAVLSLGEITRWKSVIQDDENLLELINKTKELGKRVDGHTAGAKYPALNALARAGVESCHESINEREMLEKLRLGYYLMLRESSLRQDLGGILGTVKERRLLTDRMMLTSDSSSPHFYELFGVTDHLIHIALKSGIDPVAAYRMASLNPAVYFGLDHYLGGIAPGRSADILVLSDLYQPTPEKVISRGKLAGPEAAETDPFSALELEKFFTPSPYADQCRPVEENIFYIPSGGKNLRFPVIKLLSPVITGLEWVEFPVINGSLDTGEKDGLCYVALLDKQGKWVSRGIISGLANRIEGLASTFNTAAQILVIGRRPRSMAAAVDRVYQIHGGIAAVEGTETVFEWPLTLGGIMSTEPMTELAQKDRELQHFFSHRGYPFHDPLYTLLFLPNDFLPEVRVNYKGILDIRKNEVLWPRKDLI